MSTRGLFVAVALAVALFAGTATAQAAGLTVRQAKRAAIRLGHKQQRTQDVVAFQLGRPHRVSRNQIYFPYAARTKGRNYCKGRLTVKRRVRGNRIEIASRIGKQRCKQIPADAVAVESATRKLRRGLRATRTGSVRRSIARCKSLDVPRSRRSTARAVNAIAVVEAVEGPNDKALGAFVKRLRNVQTDRKVLVNGVDGWTDWVAAVRSLPAIPYPCATLRRWADKDWAQDQAPIDIASFRAVDRRTTADERAIHQAAGFLGRVGVFPRLVLTFDLLRDL